MTGSAFPESSAPTGSVHFQLWLSGNNWIDLPQVARYSDGMADVTEILQTIEQGDATAADRLLPLVYDELRKLAAAKLANEAPGQTLQPTALVHDAYVRLVDTARAQNWDSRRHFFAAAAESMRRILVEKARRKRREKHGGGARRVDLEDQHWVTSVKPEEVLEVDEAIARLGEEDPTAADVVKLRYFAGMSVAEAAEALNIHRATAHRHWAFARAWIRADVKAARSSDN